MKIKELDFVFDENYHHYCNAVNRIKECVNGYESEIKILINFIESCETLEDANIYFIQLQHIQKKLSRIVFVNNMDIGRKMIDFVRCFDDIYSNSSKEYWFKRIKNREYW